MTSLALALALASSQPLGGWTTSANAWTPPWWGSAGRLVTRPTWHLGARMAAFVDNEAGGHLELGVGGTVQLSLRIGAW